MADKKKDTRKAKPGSSKDEKRKPAKLGDHVKTKGSLPSMRYC